MRCFLVFAAAAALVVAGGACGSIIPVPDQGVVVLGCASPAACYVSDCSCNRADAQQGGKCTVPPVCINPLDRSTCLCPATISGTGADMMPITTQCLETAQACVGRGVFCGGMGARCVAAGTMCGTSGGDPPQLLPMTGLIDGGVGVGPALEPHCQFTDDICCPGADGGVSD
jgi:hypothetical protein